MSRKEIFALKLQMGISPSMHIEPNILRTMWQQLTFENEFAQRSRSSSVPQPVPVTTYQP